MVTRCLIVLAMSLCVACDVEKPGPVGPAGTGGCVGMLGCGSHDAVGSSSESSSGSSSSSGGSDECAAYIGCFDACQGDDCSASCAAVTGVDADACEVVRCDALVAACGDGDAAACADLASCVPDDASSSSADCSTTGA